MNQPTILIRIVVFHLPVQCFSADPQGIRCLAAVVNLDDSAGSIYNIPSYELSGYGLNSGGAHEVGVMQCLDMIELMGKPLPKSNVLGIVPATISFHMGLSPELSSQFDSYVGTIINYLKTCDIEVVKKEIQQTLVEIIDEFKYPTSLDPASKILQVL